MKGVERLLDALRLIDQYGCTNSTDGRCFDPDSGRTRGVHYSAKAWCDACVAAFALREHEQEAPS